MRPPSSSSAASRSSASVHDVLEPLRQLLGLRLRELTHLLVVGLLELGRVGEALGVRDDRVVELREPGQATLLLRKRAQAIDVGDDVGLLEQPHHLVEAPGLEGQRAQQDGAVDHRSPSTEEPRPRECAGGALRRTP